MNNFKIRNGHWVKVLPYHDEKLSYTKKVYDGKELDALSEFQGHVEPIPIDEEFLLKNDFEKTGENYYRWKYNQYDDLCMCCYGFESDKDPKKIEWHFGINVRRDIEINAYFEFVNEFQDALFLCKSDFEVKI